MYPPTIGTHAWHDIELHEVCEQKKRLKVAVCPHDGEVHVVHVHAMYKLDMLITRHVKGVCYAIEMLHRFTLKPLEDTCILKCCSNHAALSPCSRISANLLLPVARMIW